MVSLLAVAVTLLAAQTPTRPETEPNHTTGSATVVALGDSVVGVVNPVGDVDYFAFDLVAGTQWHVVVDPTQSLLNHTLSLWMFGPDGSTSIIEHDWQDTEARIMRYLVPSSGRYYVRIKSYQPTEGGPAYGYTLTSSAYVPPQTGPGDPASPVALPLPVTSYGRLIGGLVAGPGYVLVHEWLSGHGNRILRVDLSGEVTTFASNVGTAGWLLVMDTFGDLLSPGCTSTEVGCGTGVIRRITAKGELSRFASGDFWPASIAVAPDGDVWLGDQINGELWRFDPLGHVKTRIKVPAYPVGAMAFSPAGQLHFVSGQELYRLEDGVPRAVVALPHGGTSLAFDRDGFLYVATYGRHPDYHDNGRIQLLDPEYRVIVDRFANVGDGFARSELDQLVFLRDASGAMTRRLLVRRGLQSTVPRYNSSYDVLELNAAGIRAPGWALDGKATAVDVEALGGGTLGEPYEATVRLGDGTQPTTLSVISGLPPGLTFSSATRSITGVPIDTGSFVLRVFANTASGAAVGAVTVRIAPVDIPVEAVWRALLDPNAPLPDALAKFIDRHGNNNGQLDVGDLRAYLRNNTHQVLDQRP